MSQRWLKFLEKIGSGNREAPILTPLPPAGHTPQNWTAFQKYDLLFQLYGPIAGSPWVPYQCPTLFASIDKRAAPKRVEMSPAFYEQRPPGAWQWLGPDTMVLLDLSGQTVIEMGVVLMMEAGVQFISTFDHWLRGPSTVIDSSGIVNAMATLGPDVLSCRQKLGPEAPPVWLCDSRRLGNPRAAPRTGTFDNRYYIDDSILPGVKTLAKAGIKRVVYFDNERARNPTTDLTPFLDEVHKAGMTLHRVLLMDRDTWVTPLDMTPPPVSKLPLTNYSKSDLGGFGKLIPVPSEGGTYSSSSSGG